MTDLIQPRCGNRFDVYEPAALGADVMHYTCDLDKGHGGRHQAVNYNSLEEARTYVTQWGSDLDEIMKVVL